ncbi:probable F420-dependent oxidoreductase, Rv2161c family [Amycolatopsis xylanica]|uniref:Probable F420-dependent oxidoreductase, Rv2161c family n=1 Tax=Amycolatopsis xylanica TaxID=589385 RepID=A0A1H3IK00_9PSEU|nr:LLM class F420-dependent oxidoreductase [Amycolatopsis xylanica]SDY28163.1 probable F420-dependent oxidoreductase, Rv2161c family [Amycolatopsis xylanica]
MKFGVATFVTDEGIRPDLLGKALEERGFESLFVAEHSHIPLSRETPYPGGGELPRVYYRTLDPFVSLTAAAVATENLLLGTGIALVMQRDTIHTAKEVASLDLVSGGRFLFGVGAGWNREEMADHGTDPRTRGAKLDEQLAALKEIWTKDAPEFHGKYVEFGPMGAWPKPVQKPHPPIYVGGNTPAALNRLKRYGDVWTPNGVGERSQIQAQLDLLHEHAGDFPVSVFGVGTKNLDVLEGYVEAGVERITLLLGTKPEAETLTKLDELAKLVERYR